MPPVMLTLRPAYVKLKVRRTVAVSLDCRIVTGVHIGSKPPITLTPSASVEYIAANGLPTAIEVDLLEGIKRRFERLAKNYLGQPGYYDALFVKDLQALSRDKAYMFTTEEVKPGQVEASCFYRCVDTNERDVFFLGIGSDLGLSYNADSRALMVYSVTSLMNACGMKRLLKITRPIAY